MPYISKEAKYFLTVGDHPIIAGELNYLFTKLAIEYINTNGKTYRVLNDVIGALEACKMEFYRKVVVPYEDKKILENGDVFHILCKKGDTHE